MNQQNDQDRPTVLVSACLCGIACRYDGKSKPDERIRQLWQEGRVVPFCPESAGGLKIPRDPSEIVDGDGADVLSGGARVLSRSGTDVTDAYLSGARKALACCRAHGIERAVLKSKSPSCGCGVIHDGSFGGGLRAGDGVTAALLKQNGIRVCTEEEDDERE